MSIGEIFIYGMAAITGFWLVVAVAMYLWVALRWIGGAAAAVVGDLWG